MRVILTQCVNDDFNEAQDQKKDNNGIQERAGSSTRKITPVSDEDLKRRKHRKRRSPIPRGVCER